MKSAVPDMPPSSMAATQSETSGNDDKAFLLALLRLGNMMLDAGGEISRTEETIYRMGTAYGATRVDVFVIPSGIWITLQLPGSGALSEMRRILSTGSTDFHRLEKLNALSRRFCASPFAVSELQEALRKIGEEEIPLAALLVGSALAAGSFSVFFGGSVMDGIVSACFALVICYLRRGLGKTRLNPAAFNLLISLLTGLGVACLAHYFPALHTDFILIGDIMLLIPGIAMTNAIQNILVGNTISGVLRLTESLVWTVALACGFMVAIWIVNTVL